MKNLMVTLALVVGLLSTSVSFADEVTSTDSRLSAFEDVQSFSASDEELKVAGEGVKTQIVKGTLDLYNIGKSYRCALSGKSGCTLPKTYNSAALKAAQKIGIIR